MAKITGFLQKVFGQAATNIGQVGSAALGTKLITNDPDTIQALAAFENGINDVALTAKRIIPQEEFMALHYLHTLQNAYAQQEGIQEYNSEVTYYTNSIVKKSGTYELYGSLVNDNIGNSLTDGTKWELLVDLSDFSGLPSQTSHTGESLLTDGSSPYWAFPAKLSTASGSAPSYAARAWVNFVGTGTVSINGSGNVSSITDNGTGDYSINFTTAMPSVNYCVTATTQRAVSGLGNSGVIYGTSNTLTTSTARIVTQNADATNVEDMAVVHVAAFA